MSRGDIPHPEWQPVIDALRAEMAKRDLNAYRLGALLFGRAENGNPIRAQYLYDILRGRSRLSDDVRQLLRDKVQIELPAYPPPAAAPATPVRAAVQLYERHQQQPLAPNQWGRKTYNPPIPPNPPRQSAPAAPPPRFALVVGQDGRANLTLNILDVAGADALKALQVLLAAGLVAPGETQEAAE